MKRIITTVLLSGLCLGIQSSSAWAQSRALDALTKMAMSGALVEKEGLTAPVPTGFKLADSQVRPNGDEIIQYVPEAETATDWRVMVVVIKLNRPLPLTLEQLDAGVSANMSAYCAASESRKLAEGNENSYPYTEWLVACPLNVRTHKPEFMVTKTIKGNYSAISINYTVQEKVTDERIAQATAYLKTVKSCDPDKPAPDCPAAQ